MISIFGAMAHNVSIIKDAEKIINSFINADDCRIWLEDESGQRFVPHGKLKIGLLQMPKVIRKE